ncbi:MAG: hypothetical protein OSB58_02945 [Alphaproteobacteria bacterium]|jgi:hypothetical protein|nr:hypothetical protein [Alphaproteobacteria bacterium]
MEEQVTGISTRLKLLVGVMTTLLVVGLILMVVGIARTSKELSEQSEQLAAKIGDVPVQIAPGDSLLNVSASSGKLYLAVSHRNGKQSIIVIDAMTGERLGQLKLEVSP